MRRALLSLTVLLWAIAAPDLRAQISPAGSASGGAVQLDIVVPGGTLAATEAPSIVSGNLLADPKTRDLLRNGFPARLHFRVELWRENGWFDDIESSTEWDVFVSYDPATEQYRVIRRHGNRTEDFGSFPTIGTTEALIDAPYKLSVRPRLKSRRYYYNVVLDVATLEEGDLDALQRWLRGGLQPAVRGKTNPASALRNGVGTLISRLLGGERRHYERRSEAFTAG